MYGICHLAKHAGAYLFRGPGGSVTGIVIFPKVLGDNGCNRLRVQISHFRNFGKLRMVPAIDKEESDEIV
jgi:hypothetical protein